MRPYVLAFATVVTLAVGVVLATARPAHATGFKLRPIDEATVRIFTVKGVHGRWVVSKNSDRRNRFVAMGEGSHGTGVVVTDDGVIMTAKHVVGTDPVVGVLLPGSDDALRAHVLHRDPNHDIAFLKIDMTGLKHVRLPNYAPSLAAMQAVSVSGYPVSSRERLPAATSGQVSRLNNDGRIQLAMSLNPGNSGGAVVDDKGGIVGLVTHRGNVKQGVTGIVLVEPVGRVLKAYQAHILNRPKPTVYPEEWDGQLTAMARWLNDGPLSLLMRPMDAAELRMLAAESSPQLQVALAARVWNAVHSELDRRGLASADALPGPEAQRAKAQLAAVREICNQVHSSVGKDWRFAREVVARGGPKVSTFRGAASSGGRSSVLTRRRVPPQEGLLDIQGHLSVHAITALGPIFGIGVLVGGHASVVRFGEERGSQFLVYAGGGLGLTTTFGDFEEMMLTGTIDIGIGGRFGGFELSAFYAPGVSMLLGEVEWAWDGFRIEAGSGGGRVNYGTAYYQIGHSIGTIRALTGYIKANF